MIVVNLFGAPSAGKSTCASLVFTNLKMERVNVELVTEFAKEKTWEKNELALENQAFIFGSQYYMLSRLMNKVDVVITDSPLLLSILYNRNPVLGEPFNQTVLNVFNSFQNVNYFLNRATKYDPNGRWETEEESDVIADKLKNILKERNISYKDVAGNKQGYEKITEEVIKLCHTLNLNK